MRCIGRNTYRKTQGDMDYCVLYHPSRLVETYCPYLEKESVPITLGEGIFSVKLNYWKCHHNEFDLKTDQKVIHHMRRRISGS